MDTPKEPKKTLKLKIEKQINFKIIGISSHENDYRIVWEINEKLGMQFLRVTNLVVHIARLKKDMEFSRYLFDDEDRYLKYFLISNRCPDGFLFPEIKNLDFVLQIIGELTAPDLKGIEKKIKSLNVVSAAFTLQPEKIKGIGNILVI
ncbi:MAG TPA: IPExxxVDY family protein [Bacteroidales bacterium]|nr:IPExxxVDY family protein [Bacteroidales bacterium]